MTLVVKNELIILKNLAATYSSAWQSLALSADDQHILSSYGDSSQSWSLLYNLYADKLLQTNIVGDNVRRSCLILKRHALTLPQIYQLSANYYKGLFASGVGQ